MEQGFFFPQGSPEQQKQDIMRRLSGQQPQNMGQGFQSLADGLRLRQLNQGAFPQAPGGANPSFGQNFLNLFGFGGGGLS